MKRTCIALVIMLVIPITMAADLFPNACVDCHMKDKRISVLLKGKHPPVAAKNIPASCMTCHSATSKKIAPLSKVMHRVHFAKGDSEFVKKFQGDCRHCHKLQTATGVMTIPSGAEK